MSLSSFLPLSIYLCLSLPSLPSSPFLSHDPPLFESILSCLILKTGPAKRGFPAQVYFLNNWLGVLCRLRERGIHTSAVNLNPTKYRTVSANASEEKAGLVHIKLLCRPMYHFGSCAPLVSKPIMLKINLLHML
jgi:hypothetical protein